MRPIIIIYMHQLFQSHHSIEVRITWCPNQFIGSFLFRRTFPSLFRGRFKGPFFFPSFESPEAITILSICTPLARPSSNPLSTLHSHLYIAYQQLSARNPGTCCLFQSVTVINIAIPTEASETINSPHHVYCSSKAETIFPSFLLYTSAPFAQVKTHLPSMPFLKLLIFTVSMINSLTFINR